MADRFKVDRHKGNQTDTDYLKSNKAKKRRRSRPCGLKTLPDRRIFDRRLSTISTDIKERIATVASLFVKEKLVDPYIVAIDRWPKDIHGTGRL